MELSPVVRVLSLRYCVWNDGIRWVILGLPAFSVCTDVPAGRGSSMDADDRAGMSPEHLDRLARGVLRAARDAAWELRQPQDPDRRTWALGKLAGQTQAMLGPDLPDYPPIGAAAQEGFVRTALELALHVRAHSWSQRDLGAVGVRGQDDVPHPGESRTADAFDVLGRLMLPHTSPEGWTATLVTDLAHGDKTLEAAVKLGKYVLHPTFLLFTDDATRVVGEALHSLNVRRLHELTNTLRHYAGAAPQLPPAVTVVATPLIMETASDVPESVFHAPPPGYRGETETASDVPDTDVHMPPLYYTGEPETVSGVPETVFDHMPPLGYPGETETAINRMSLVDEPDDLDIDIPGPDRDGRGPRRFGF
ncbi:hypothetical protein [Streptomyces sp. NPDC017991]|uniref:hypothetical protein n=1 Tax=Streptomyces sp. NPDC017991 TaxID=3365026 RepID=UPI0037A28401